MGTEKTVWSEILRLFAMSLFPTLEVEVPAVNISAEKKLDLLVREMASLRNDVKKLALIEEQVKANEREVKILRDDSKEVRNLVSDMQTELGWLRSELCHVRSQSERNEAQERRFNILISGVEEINGKESWAETEKVVQDLFKDKLEIVDPPYIQRAHRIGPYRPNLQYPRTIVVKFRDHPAREMVLRARIKLAGTKIFINEHFTDAVLEVRKKLWEWFRGAHDRSGRRPRLTYDKIWFDNSLYAWNYDSNEPVIVRSIPRPMQNQDPLGLPTPQGGNSQPVVRPRESHDSLMPTSQQDFQQVSNMTQPSFSQIIPSQPRTTQISSQPYPSQNIVNSQQPSLLADRDKPTNIQSRARTFHYKRLLNDRSSPPENLNPNESKRGRGSGRRGARNRTRSLSRTRETSTSKKGDQEDFIMGH